MMEAILISGILQGLALIALLLRNGFNKTPNRILAALVLILSAHLCLIVIDVKDLLFEYPHFSRLSWLLPLCYGPLILLLTQSIVQSHFLLNKKHLGYFLPFAVYLIILTPYFFSDASYKIACLTQRDKVFEADFGWMNHLSNYLHISFLLTALVVYKRGKSKISVRYHHSGHISLAWFGKFLIGILIILLFSLMTFYAKKYGVLYFSTIYPKHFLLVVVLVYWTGYKLLQQKSDVQTPIPLEETRETYQKYSKTGLDATESKSIAARVEKYMESEKPHLDPSLTLPELGNLLSLSKHQLSQVINQEFQVNFFEFLNNYRIAEFKKQTVNPDNAHLSLLGIAFESGFNSKATFNQVFKKKEGMTPSAFLKQQKSTSLHAQNLMQADSIR